MYVVLLLYVIIWIVCFLFQVFVDYLGFDEVSEYVLRFVAFGGVYW